MVCFNSSILPVIALPFGQCEVSTNTETTAKRATKRTDIKHTWLVFCSKTPNIAYVLNSENSNDVMVPKLTELVKLPKITLNGLQNFENELSAKTILKMIEFFSSPLNEIEGITPLTLLNSGMITNDLFLTIVKDHLSVALKTLDNGDQVTDDKLLEFTYKVASHRLGLSNETDSLADRVKRHLMLSTQKSAKPNNTETIIDIKSQTIMENDIPENSEPVVRTDKSNANGKTAVTV